MLEALKLIGRAFGRHSSAIFAHLRPHGGIRPAPRRRSRRVLSLAEREEISRGLAKGSLAAVDRGGTGPRCLDAEPGAAPQWRPGSLSRCHVGSPGVGPGASS